MLRTKSHQVSNSKIDNILHTRVIFINACVVQNELNTAQSSDLSTTCFYQKIKKRIFSIQKLWQTEWNYLILIVFVFITKITNDSDDVFFQSKSHINHTKFGFVLFLNCDLFFIATFHHKFQFIFKFIDLLKKF